MAQSLALSSSTKNSEKLNQAGSNFPPELSFQFIYSSMSIPVIIIEIINNTRTGIVIFFQSKKGNALLGGKFKSRMQGQALIG